MGLIDGRDQRALALDRANQVRLEAARLRAQIRAAGLRGGARQAAEVVMAGSSPMPFFRLLCAVPQVGEREARWMLSQAQIGEMARVDSELVSRRRRELLAGELLKHGERAGA